MMKINYLMRTLKNLNLIQQYLNLIKFSKNPSKKSEKQLMRSTGENSSHLLKKVLDLNLFMEWNFIISFLI